MRRWNNRVIQAVLSLLNMVTATTATRGGNGGSVCLCVFVCVCYHADINIIVYIHTMLTYIMLSRLLTLLFTYTPC